MPTRIKHLRADAHPEIGELIERESDVLIARWAERAKAEQPTAARVHHEVLLNHLPQFLRQLGRALATEGDESSEPRRVAGEHGDQRWDAGWSITEVVRDYQLLRMVLVESLESLLSRRMCTRESLVLNAAIDDAIGASVASFVDSREAVPNPMPDPSGSPDLLLNVLGVVGHELRNPLAPLANSLEILRLSGNDPAQVERTRQMLARQLRILSRLVDDLMDLPRLRLGKLTLRRERLDLSQLVRNGGEERRSGLSAAGLELVVDVPPTPTWVLGDEARLSQALGNLLANAQKFTDPGGIVILRLTVHERVRAVISVRDTGIGIEPSLLPTIFEAYMQADQSLHRSRGGLGLGLAMVKGVIELHEGSVRALSEGPGHGATFAVELPLSEPVDSETPPAEPGRQDMANTSRRVLIIEDDIDSAESLGKLLSLFGHTVRVAHSGPAGLAAAASEPFDVAICDVGLPGMDGYSVATAIRNLENPPVFLVALTGYQSRNSDHEDSPNCFDVHLLKPIDPTHLLEMIDRLADVD